MNNRASIAIACVRAEFLANTASFILSGLNRKMSSLESAIAVMMVYPIAACELDTEHVIASQPKHVLSNCIRKVVASAS